ncbi:hypothetical protein H9Q69_007802 [Fusarium xylarioides]|nr:hypothetical protein H9Q69_007802 [Fusarium xylarioides]
MDSDSDPLLVPLQLQAFVLNPSVCNTDAQDDHNARIVPITQPNYTFLRLDNFLIQSDVLNHADLHCSAPAEANPRLTDLGARPPVPRRDRHGVYLHWILPQTYRSGVASADSVSKERREDERLRRGLAPGKPISDPRAGPTKSPEFLEPPTRWIIVRKLDLDSISPVGAKPFFKEYQAWVIESDYQWALECIPPDYDLQVDVYPFILGVKSGDDTNIEQQAEVFIGRKTPLEDWSECESAHRVDISLLRSSNQFFADFQLHNSNVFSTLDNFQYNDGSSEKPQFLQKATASYYLLGWHRDELKDPLWRDDVTREQRLQGIFMALQESGIEGVTKSWPDSKDPARICLHGALYDVHWDHENKPVTVPADAFSKTLRSNVLPAVSVGTTPIDALITYCSSRSDKEQNQTIKKLEEDILLIDSLLHARDDGVEGQREAKDISYNWSFNRSKGGIHYFIAGQEEQGQPTKPEPGSIDALRTLNKHQYLLDACRKGAEQYRWDMFSLWWKYVTDVTNKDDDDVNRQYQAKVKTISDRLGELNVHMEVLDAKITVMKEEGQAEGGTLQGVRNGTEPFFYRARDPTVLLGGVDSGWPIDFNDSVKVRIPPQTVSPSTTTPSSLSDLASVIASKFPDQAALKNAGQLCSEFWALLPSNTEPAGNLPEGQIYPQFHDKLSSTSDNTLWRDRWEDRQPWFPLYAEWEIEYTHVPFEFWQLDQQASRVSDSKKTRYGIPADDGTPLWEKMKLGKPEPIDDIRVLSGRVLILPQPSFSLNAKVRQLFADTPPQILKESIPLEKQTRLIDNINRLSFLSAPLAGLTEGLLTLSQGTHIKPENKFVKDGQQLSSAIRAATYPLAGFSAETIEKIQNNSALTPYASMSDFSVADFCPFKPATHGQFRFTKFNVIDKFGQALVAIDPKPRVDGPEPLYPCISDYYEPQPVTLKDETKVANTVMKNSGLKCEFIQLPPQINQNSRLNVSFVVYAGDEDVAKSKPYWRPATEWENPIWGWVVLNYADQGIQLFLPSGAFYREIRFGGPGGVITEPKWLPFKRDDTLPPVENVAQLDALINRMGNDPDYARGFWDMLSMAVDNMAPAPSAYAEFLSSIVGRPMALANMGWSLELEGAPLANQSTRTSNSTKEPLMHLISRNDDDKNAYKFQLKLGDFFREYDGLVGYFDANRNPDPNNNRGDELLLDEVKTYFCDGSKATNLTAISKDNYPKFNPFWIEQFHDSKPVEPEAYADKRIKELQIFGAIFDPFTPIHGYSSILPPRSLQLPSWTWQDAMQNMTAFFHAGPLTLTQDVGKYDLDNPLTTETVKKRPARNAALPALDEGEWSWLQPFVDDKGGSGLPLYNAYGIEVKGNPLTPGFEKGPYTAIEGFLQLRQPLLKDKPDKPV